MASPVRTALGNALRWLCNVTIVLVAMGILARNYGFERGTLWLASLGALAGLLLVFRPARCIYPALLVMCLVGLFSVVGIAIDHLTGGHLFVFKHSHFDRLLGAPWVEDRKSEGAILHIFDDGWDSHSYYAVRTDRSWFPQVSVLPDSWRSGDPFPEKMAWETMTH